MPDAAEVRAMFADAVDDLDKSPGNVRAVDRRLRDAGLSCGKAKRFIATAKVVLRLLREVERNA